MKLEATYASKGPARKATLLKQLVQHKLSDDGDVREHLSKFFDTIDKLNAMDVEMNGDLLTIMLLYSLPDCFENFRCAIETRDTLPDAESLKIKIIEENDARIRRSDHNEFKAMFAKQNLRGSRNSSNDPGKAKTFKKPKYKCNFCRKQGHKESECYSKKKKQDEAKAEAKAEVKAEAKANCTELSFFVNKDSCSKIMPESQDWCLDNGCTSPLCNNRDSFLRFQNTDSKIKLANASTAEVKARGDVGLKVCHEKINKSINLENTLYVPELRTNLMSVAKIVDKDHEVVFKRTHAVIRDIQGNTKMIANDEEIYST